MLRIRIPKVIKIHKVKNLDKDALVLFVFYVLFMFQVNLQTYLSPFQFFDEGMFLLLITRYFLNFFKGKTYVTKEVPICLALIGTIIVIGVIGNYTTKIQTGLSPMFMDIINSFKCLLVLFCMSAETYSRKTIERFLRACVKLIRVLLFFAVPLAMLNIVVDIGMSYDVRFGIRSFTFIFYHAGTLNMICYIWIVTLSAALMIEEERKRTLITIGFTLIIWFSTLRSRGMTYAFIYTCMLILVLWKKELKVSGPVLVGVAGFAFYIVKDQMETYFADPTAPRAVLLYYGAVTMKRFFPIGAGFGTFGSSTAQKYYSKLYYEYGFDHMYGMNPDDCGYLTDCYWPQIMGQFGLIGTVLLVVVIGLVLAFIFKRTSHCIYLKLGCLIGYLCIILATIAVNSLANFIAVGLFALIGLLCCNIVDDKETNSEKPHCENEEKVV